jgi:hypothetical protein
MADTKIYGYMLTLKWGTKLIKGLETTGLSLKANFEEICLKADAGVPTDDFIDFDTDLKLSGKTIEKDAGETASHEDFEELRVALSVGAEIAFVYGRMAAGEKIVSGTLTLREWSEDAGSKKEMGTWSGSAKAKKGSVTFGVTAA